MPDRAPGPSVRVTLALSYAAFVIIVGIAVFALGFLLLRFVPEGNLTTVGGLFVPSRTDLVEVFVRYAWWTLLGLAVVGLVGGWIVAGIMVRPLTRITDAARRAAGGSFAHRIALSGRRDELTDLADTFDEMLERVERTLDEQRRFAANASHELRTPHAIIRTMVEVARADPNGRDVDLLLARLEEINERSIALTEGLLALSAAAHGKSLDHAAVDFGTLVEGVAEEWRTPDSGAGRSIGFTAEPVAVRGDRVLLEQLVDNLVRNAVVHNRPDDPRIRVVVRRAGDEVVLEVVNTGLRLSEATVDTLAEPFVRGVGRTRGHDDRGAGLGLAIVRAIVTAHHGRLELHPLAGGGLLVRVALPRADGADSPRARGSGESISRRT